MEIDSKTEKKLQKIVAGISKGNIVDAMGMVRLNNNEKEQFMYLATMNFLFSQSAKFRGKVIDITVFMEMVIAQILSKYFTANERKESLLNSFVFDRMQLSVKFNLIKKIVKVSHPKLWKKYQRDLKEIESLIEFRNNLAHSMLDSSEDYITSLLEKTKDIALGGKGNIEEIQVGFYKNGDFKYEEITQRQIDEYYTKCSKKIGILQQLSKELNGEEL